jgi:hypothetical protein
MRHLLALAALAASVVSFTGIADAQVAAGTALAGTITQSISSNHAYVGEPVTLRNVSSESGSIRGATMYGTVTSAVPAGQGRPGKVQMRFTRLVLPSGATYAVDGVVSGMQANTKNNALKEAGGALAGMLIGNMIGKTIFHTGIGGFLGAAGGFLIAKNNRQNVVVPSGTAVRVTVRSARRQATHY